ncbi:MAG: DUF421 domain-containing protein [Bacillota bacterium]|nr:DUF421 domain-containing protein [Bacillota bacterium]
MFIVLLRTIILFIVVIVSLRIMGKRQIGQLQPYELVVAIMISELASLPMQDTRIPLAHGIIPIITLLVIQIIISLVELKSTKARSLIDGKPCIVISKGEIVISELKNQVFTVNDLMEELRINGHFNIEDIEYGILETNGQISVILKGDAEPATKKDVKVQSKVKLAPLTLIMEGTIIMENLKILNKDEKWIQGELAKKKIQSEKEVFLAVMKPEGDLFIQDYKTVDRRSMEVDL